LREPRREGLVREAATPLTIGSRSTSKLKGLKQSYRRQKPEEPL
jgi:hypothetical protein